MFGARGGQTVRNARRDGFRRSRNWRWCRSCDQGHHADRDIRGKVDPNSVPFGLMGRNRRIPGARWRGPTSLKGLRYNYETMRRIVESPQPALEAFLRTPVMPNRQRPTSAASPSQQKTRVFQAVSIRTSRSAPKHLPISMGLNEWAFAGNWSG